MKGLRASHIFWTAVALSFAALAVGYGLHGYWPGSLVSLGFAALWVLIRRRSIRLSWASSLLFVFSTAAAVMGALIGLVPWLMLLAISSAMAAWDLDFFLRRMETADLILDRARLERQHLLKLGAVEGIALTVGTVALLIHLQVGFGMEVFLGALTVALITQAVGFIRRLENSPGSGAQAGADRRPLD